MSQHTWSSVVSKPYITYFIFCVSTQKKNDKFMFDSFQRKQSPRTLFENWESIVFYYWYTIVSLKSEMWKSNIYMYRQYIFSPYVVNASYARLYIYIHVGMYYFCTHPTSTRKHTTKSARRKRHYFFVFYFLGQTSAQVRIPAEFKHIIKRRKRN